MSTAVTHVVKLAVGSALLGLSFFAQADDRFFFLNRVQTTVSGMSTFNDSDVDGASILTRTRDRVGFTLNTRELAADAPYTIWWVTFNNPEKCEEPCACGSDADFADPDVDIGVFWATGRFSDTHGQGVFSAEVAFGELPTGPDQVPFDPDFASPIKKGAEMHLVVRAHGETMDSGEEQLTQFNGGCAEPGMGEIDGDACVDVQFSIHQSPSCRI